MGYWVGQSFWYQQITQYVAERLCYIDLVEELVLHKNRQAKNNICTLYLLSNYQNWLVRVEDIASQSRHSR